MPRKSKTKNNNILIQTLINKPQFKRLLKDVPYWVEEKAFWLFGDNRTEYKYIPAKKVPMEIYERSRLDGAVQYKIGQKYVNLTNRCFVIDGNKIYYYSEDKIEENGNGENEKGRSKYGKEKSSNRN